MVVPSKAVVELMGEYFVFVAKDTTVRDAKDTTKTQPAVMAIEKKVVTGQTIAPNVIIKSGIKVGDKIVSDGVQSLHTGSIITTSAKAGNAKGENSNGNSPSKKSDSQGNSDKPDNGKK